MEYRNFGRQIVIRLDEGDEIVAEVMEVCRREQVSAALVQGIGFTDEMKIRIYDRDSDTFLFHTVKEPMEITSLTGNIARADNGLYAHLHIMAADREMNVKGGHLISFRIAAAGEIVLNLCDGVFFRGASDDQRLGPISFEEKEDG